MSKEIVEVRTQRISQLPIAESISDKDSLVANVGGVTKTVKKKHLLNEVNARLDIIIQNNLSVSVKDFGGIGDGINDDTQALKNAIKNSNCVYIPSGTYLITDTIVIDKPITLYGENINTTLLKFSDNVNKDFIIIDNTEKVNIKNLTLNHGNQDEKEISVIKIDGEKNLMPDDHHNINDIHIISSNTGVLLSSQVRETRLTNIEVRGRGKRPCFEIYGTDNYLLNCTAAGSKSHGFYIEGNNNKLTQCKAFWNDLNGFNLYQSNFGMYTNCESQENGRNGFSIIESNFNNMNILSDTNGRLNHDTSSNIYVNTIRKNIINAVCSCYSGLEGLVKNHVELNNVNLENTINVTTNSDVDNRITPIEHGNSYLKLLTNTVFLNGREIKTNMIKMDKMSSIRNMYDCFIKEINQSQWVNTIVVYRNNHLYIEGKGNAQYQGYKLQTTKIPVYDVRDIYCYLKGFTYRGNMECCFQFYNNDTNIGASDRIGFIYDGIQDTEHIIYGRATIPSGCTHINLLVSIYPHNETDFNYAGEIADIGISIF